MKANPTMPFTLLLLRHGKSDWSTDLPDIQRPLIDRGKRAAQKIGNYLLEQRLYPEATYTSPARRARDTAEKCIKAAGLDPSEIVIHDDLYHGGLSDMRKLVTDLRNANPGINCALLVGHNPEMEALACELADMPVRQGKIVPTATLVIIEYRDDGFTSLKQVVYPDTLNDRFFYPSTKAPEYRARPAYYYRQSGVIAYRKNGDDIEILLIAKPKPGKTIKKWQIQKGIVEPGLSARDSAMKEALEESGATGITTAAPMGQLTFSKWGAECQLEVFAMEVEHLSDDYESKRLRQWFSVKNLPPLKLEALKPMMLSLQERAGQQDS